MTSIPQRSSPNLDIHPAKLQRTHLFVETENANPPIKLHRNCLFGEIGIFRVHRSIKENLPFETLLPAGGSYGAWGFWCLHYLQTGCSYRSRMDLIGVIEPVNYK